MVSPSTGGRYFLRAVAEVSADGGAGAPRVLILGCGFLGSQLARRCAESGARVLAVDAEAGKDATEATEASEVSALVRCGAGCAAVLRGDAAEARVLSRALGLLGVPDELFVCTATHGGSPAAYRRAYGGVLEALLPLLPTGARLVFCSSVSVYAESAGGAVDESSLCVPSAPRVRALLEAEALALEAGGVVARLSPLYDAGRCELLRRHEEGEPRLPGPGARCLNYVHREDAVEALRLMARLPGGGVFNVCGESLSVDEAYAMLEELTGVLRAPEEAACSRRGLSNRRVLCPRLRAAGWRPRHSLRAFVSEALRP